MRLGLHSRITGALLTFVFCLFAGLAWAQADDQLQTWDRIATGVQSNLQESELSIEDLERIRSTVVDWRDRLADAADQEDTEVIILRQQISALGPVPAEGESESEEIASRRAELNQTLANVRRPQIEAEEAFARADALVRRIDDRLRSLQADLLFERQESPLRPSHWGETLRLLGDVVAKMQNEVVRNVQQMRNMGTFWSKLPLVTVLLAAAIIFITRGPRWIERLIARLGNRTSTQAQVLVSFIISLGSIFLPLAGISLLNAAVISTGLLGPVGRATAIGLNFAIGTYAVARWLGSRVFPEQEASPTPIPLDEAGRHEGRRLTKLGGLLTGITVVMATVDSVEEFDGVLLSVLAFPIIVVLGFVLFRMGSLIHPQPDPRATTEGSGYTDFLRSIAGRVLQLAAFVGPALAAVGYFNLALGIIYPVTLTVAVVGLLMILHYVIRATYGLLRGLNAEQAEAALFPVLITLILTFISMPIVSLFWGVRSSDLDELWTRFKAGVQVGETTISPADFLTFAAVFGIIYMLTRLIQGVLKNSVLPRTRIEKGGRNAIVSGLGYVGITLAFLGGVNAAGIDLTSLTIIVGALGVGIGFGLQTIVNNFVSGIILLIEQPIAEGDWIEVNGQMGVVKSISVRSTVIETFDRTDVIVPNGDFVSGTVTNWTRGSSIGRVIVPVGVAYGTDTRKVEDILMGIAKAHPIVAVTPPPTVLFRGFGTDSLDFEIRAILTDVNYILSVHSDMNHEIARRFTEEGIEIPFSQRDIWLRNPETLHDIAPPPPAKGPQQGPREASMPLDPSLASPDDGDAR